MRTFLTLDGDVLEKSEWKAKPTDRCFYCNGILVMASQHCPDSQDGNHDWVTVTNP